MVNRGSGKSCHKGITFVSIIKMFDTEEKAEAWFVEQRWPDGPACPFCDSDKVSPRPSRKPQPFRCRSCRKDFSITTGTLLHRTRLPLSKWAVGFYLYATNLKGVSNLKLHRDLGITQKTAWYMAHRIRQMMENCNAAKLANPVEADEPYIGSKEANKHAKELRAERGCWTGGEAAVSSSKHLETVVLPSSRVGTIVDELRDRPLGNVG